MKQNSKSVSKVKSKKKPAATGKVAGFRKRFLSSRRQKTTAIVVGVLALAGLGYWGYSAYVMDEVSAGGCVSHTYKRGSVGSCVKYAQVMLNFTPLKDGLAVDRIYGPKTQARVKAFQKLAHLTQDGVLGRNTWAALCSRSNAPTNTKKSAGCPKKKTCTVPLKNVTCKESY